MAHVDPDSHSVLYASLAENIKALAAFSDCRSSCLGAGQSANISSTTSPDQHGHRAPFLSSPEKRERLTQALAYLCGIDAHSAHVTAVSVDHLNGWPVQVFVAINKATPECNKDVLDKIVDGLRSIFDTMKHNVFDSVTKGLDILLHEIVCLSRSAIVYRLGLKRQQPSPGKRGFPFLGTSLERVLEAFPSQAGSTHPSQGGNSNFLSKTKQLVDHLRGVCVPDDDDDNDDEGGAKGPDTNCLVAAICAVYRYAKEFDDNTIKNFLKQVPKRTMDQQAKQSLVQRVRELAAYHLVARFLVRLAREDADSSAAAATQASWLSSVAVVPVRPPSEVFANTTCGVSYSSRNSRPPSPKIHAELQIALQLDVLDNERQVHRASAAYPHGPPRPAIVSSKLACYLCHAFFACHGGYAVPPTHGTLYAGWLPPCLDWPQQSAAVSSKYLLALQRLCSVLQQQVADFQDRAAGANAHTDTGKRGSGAIESRVFCDSDDDADSIPLD